MDMPIDIADAGTNEHLLKHAAMLLANVILTPVTYTYNFDFNLASALYRSMIFAASLCPDTYAPSA